MNSIRSLLRVTTSCRVFRHKSDEPRRIVVERCINEVRLLGRCGNDPEARGPNEETAVATFNLATNALTRGESGEFDEKKVTWHNIVVFNQNLKNYVIRNLRKGDRVFLSGRLDNREYETQQGEVKRTHRIVASQIINVTNRKFNEVTADGSDDEQMS